MDRGRCFFRLKRDLESFVNMTIPPVLKGKVRDSSPRLLFIERAAIKCIPTLTVLVWCICFGARAQVTYTTTTVADTFLATGTPGTNLTGLNFGAAGVLVIAAPSSSSGEFQSVLKFDLSGATNLFNATYGADNWSVSGISLQLTGNFGAAGETPDNGLFPTINGGKFVIEWLANNDWAEGTGKPRQPTTDGATYDSLPELLSGAHDILCTNTYSPPGDNVPVTYALPLDPNLVNEVTQGGDASLLFYAADDQIGYLFNSHDFGGGNQPLIHVTANLIPPRILSGYFTNANFHLTVLGVPNLEYQVQATTDLATTNWQVIGTATADDAGIILFDDTSASNQPQRFYRLSR
jgi:hypothetical protein